MKPTITTTQTTHRPEPGHHARRRPRVGVPALAALAGLAGLTGACASGADAAPTAPAPATAGAHPSADAAERQALADREALVELCRSSIVAPDPLERCMRRGG